MNKDEKYTLRLKKHLAKAKTENRWLEFKSNHLEPDRLGRYISAMLNGACLDREDFAFIYLVD